MIKNKKSVILPQKLQDLLKARMKYLSKDVDISFILAYSSLLNYRIDIKTLELLNINNIEKNINSLSESGFIINKNNSTYINNFKIVSQIVINSLKEEAENFLIKNIIAQIGKDLDDATMALLMGKIGFYKEEYLTLWKNAQFSINTGDYDAYLKNSLGFLSLVGYIKSDITTEEIEENNRRK